MNTLAFTFIMAIFFAAVFALSMWTGEKQCDARFSAYGQTRFGFFEKCMVNYKGKWVPSTVFREVE